MKKLKLKAFELGTTEILTRQQLRNVLGGTVAASTTTTTRVDTTPKCTGTCSSGDQFPHSAACSYDTLIKQCTCPLIGTWPISNCAFQH